MIWFLAVKENIKGAEVAPCLKVETCRKNTFLDCVSSGGHIVISEKITYDFLKLNPILTSRRWYLHFEKGSLDCPLIILDKIVVPETCTLERAVNNREERKVILAF